MDENKMGIVDVSGGLGKKINSFFSEFTDFFNNFVEEEHPLKQGLKPQLSILLNTNTFRVEEEHPLKPCATHFVRLRGTGKD